MSVAPLYGWCEEEIPRDLDQTPIYLRHINAGTIKVLANITHCNEQRTSESGVSQPCSRRGMDGGRPPRRSEWRREVRHMS